MDLGLRVGLWRFWYPNGRKKTEGGFLNDQEEGEWRYWDENGKLVKRLAFRQGNFIEELPIPKKRVRIVTEVVPNPMRQFITPPRVFDENGREITPQD